jgi:hypothetical protein
MMISKIELKCFFQKLTLELFMCLRLELLDLILKFYLLGITFFFKLFFIFFWQDNFICMFSIFPNKNCQIKKIQTKKTCSFGEGRVNPTI